ncbi:MAG: prolipoprotein diacylglyceryl transferase [Desulfobacteraceae bacterium]|nr:prolipoprotein diacylglyceryl transferase [Desulfobacteraceae bacterium]
MNWWQALPYKISPYLFQISGFQVRYYSLMYIAAFVSVYWLVTYRLKTESWSIHKDLLYDFFVWAAVGVLIGGRIGYVLFYNFSYFINHPLEIILPFDLSNGFKFTGISGMSFHGGLLGVVVVFFLYCRKHKINIWDLSDLICPAIPLGYTFGRLGNFFNGELFGRPTSLPWGMYFPTDPTHTLRHPSQLYEAFFEGIILFIFLWSIKCYPRAKHKIFALYLLSYGFVRFFIEFVRQPDPQLNYPWLIFTMGQLLCAAMMVAGIALLLFQLKRPLKEP